MGLGSGLGLGQGQGQGPAWIGLGLGLKLGLGLGLGLEGGAVPQLLARAVGSRRWVEAVEWLAQGLVLEPPSTVLATDARGLHDEADSGEAEEGR